jgi:hypothetical protein
MSATGRGAERVEFDFYPTPSWCVKSFLRQRGHLHYLQNPALRWLEPCAGDGAIIQAVNEFYGTPRLWTAVELQGEAYKPLDILYSAGQLGAFSIDDFLSSVSSPGWLKWHGPFDVVFTNPPYGPLKKGDPALAELFVRKALEYAPLVVMLLRQGFLGTAERSNRWLRTNMPRYCNILPERPKFRTGERPGINPKTGKPWGKWGTDACEYAWMIWDRNCLPNDVTITTILEDASAEDKADERRSSSSPGRELPASREAEGKVVLAA